MKRIKIDEILKQAKFWAEESQDKYLTEGSRIKYRDKAMTIVTLLTNIELDRTIDFDSNNTEKFDKAFDNLYEKYKKEIFG